jgi:hypothetical protein
VVEGCALLGVIIAVYDQEPYAHMIPIASIFSGIESMPIKNLAAMKVEIRGQVLVKATQGKLLSIDNMQQTRTSLRTCRRNAENERKSQSTLGSLLKANSPMLLMMLVIGLVSPHFHALECITGANFPRTVQRFRSFSHSSQTHTTL